MCSFSASWEGGTARMGSTKLHDEKGRNQVMLKVMSLNKSMDPHGVFARKTNLPQMLSLFGLLG